MISLIHPSRNRPDQAKETCKLWLDRAVDKPNIEYILSVDKDDKCLTTYKANAKELGTYCLVSRNRSAIQAINNGAKVSNGNLLIVVSDDFDAPERWDEQLLESVKGKEDFLVKTTDGIQKTLITLPIMDRAYYNRFGYIYHPSYIHMFCDQEMTVVGHYLDRVIDVPIYFEHRHYSTGKFKKDVISAKNDKTWNHGKKNFHERLKTNFGISDPVIQYSDIVWH